MTTERDRLKVIVRIADLTPGETRWIAHGLNLAGHPLSPDHINVAPTVSGLALNSGPIYLTVTSSASVPLTVNVLLEYWHPIKRHFGGDESLFPLPFVTGIDGSSGQGPGTFSGINGDVVPLVPGMPIAQPGSTLLRASASAGEALARCLGLVTVGAEPNTMATALGDGPLMLTELQWQVVVGTLGLVPGARYYLADPGGLSTAPAIGQGKYVAAVGQAVSGVTLLVRIDSPILL